MSLFNQGQAAFQPESLTPARIGFPPVSVRFVNLAPQDATTWASAAGTATVTTGITAPDSTTDAATLTCPTSDRAYRRIYATERTVSVGDWLVCGVYVKAATLTQGANQPTSTMANYAAATLRILDDTEGYQIDIDGLNYRNLTASKDADTTWQWITTAAKIELAPSGDSATVALDLNCDPEHTVSFYAPTLWHIPADTLTDAEVQAQLLNFYPVPDAAEAGIVATLAGQSFQSKLRDAGGQVFNVRANGALGDGVTDDTLAIQAVIDEAATVAGDGYRTVLVPAGTWKVSGLSLSGKIRFMGAGDGETVIYSTENAPILDCTPYNFELPTIEKIRIRGSVTAGSSQVGLKMDDPLYGALAVVRDVRIDDCGGAGVYVGKAFSSLFENIYSSNCAGGNFVINSPNMPALTFTHCDSGVIHDSYRTGYHIQAGSVTIRDCNSIYGGSNPEWCVTVGKRVGRYGETIENNGAFVRFENCNFESSTVGGVELLYNSRASFHNCSWVGDGASSGSYIAVKYDICQVNPTETTGTINSGFNTLIVANAATWTIGQGIKIAGAGVASADLSTTITGISGTTFTLAASASTSVVGAAVIHTDEAFYATTQGRLGIIDDDCIFSNGPDSFYANSEPIHITSYPSTANAATIPLLATNGRGPKISQGKYVSSFRNDTTSKTWPLPRFDGFLPVQRLTTSTTYTGPGVRYIECDHSAPITITLPWPGSQLNSSNELIIIKDVSSAGAATNNVTIQASSGGTVNGSSYTLNVNGGAVVLVPHSDDDYRIVADYVPGGSVSGSGASTRLAYWSGTSALASDSDLTFDGFNLTSGGFKASSNGRFDFSSDTSTSDTTDLALSRFAANTLRIGGDTAGSTAGKLFVSRSDKTHTGWFTVCGDSGNTSTVDNVGALGLDSTGTAAASFGAQLLLTLESSTTNQRQAAGVTWLWTTATDASRTADLYFSTVNSGSVAEAFRVVSSGAFRSAAISDPSTLNDGDVWNASARNCYSVRQSGQTEDFSTSVWRSSGQVSFDTTSAATSILADTGVGTKTIAANRLKAGNHIRITAGGLYGSKATSAGTLTVRVTNGGTTMITAVFTLPDGVFDQVWSLEAVGAVNATGSSGTIYWRLMWLMTDASGLVYAMNYTTNSTTINTTVSRAIGVTAQFSVSNVDNYFQTDNACVEILA